MNNLYEDIKTGYIVQATGGIRMDSGYEMPYCVDDRHAHGPPGRWVMDIDEFEARYRHLPGHTEATTKVCDGRIVGYWR